MKNLYQAVQELNSLPFEEAEQLIRSLPNESSPGGKKGYRCTTCPIALYLEAKVGRPVWVAPGGVVCEVDKKGFPKQQHGDDEDLIWLDPELTRLIQQLDIERSMGVKDGR